MTEDEVVGWHQQLNAHEFEQTQGGGEGQGSLACCSPRGCKESDTTERLNDNVKPNISDLSADGMRSRLFSVYLLSHPFKLIGWLCYLFKNKRTKMHAIPK